MFGAPQGAFFFQMVHVTDGAHGGVHAMASVHEGTQWGKEASGRKLCQIRNYFQLRLKYLRFMYYIRTLTPTQ